MPSLRRSLISDMPFQVWIRRIAAISSAGLIGSVACAASISVQVADASGQPVADSAVYAEPASGQAAPRSQRTIEIEQKARKFLPLVTVIQTGSEISFPNHDTVRHHVYSFSPVKMFELKLYAGIPASPVTFDKPGTVVVGCNIHDQMLAYIHIVNTPYFAKTDASGKARLEGLAPGKYRLKAWHFNLPGNVQIPEQAINLTGSETAASFKLDIKAVAVNN
jgi:plastocyanin